MRFGAQERGLLDTDRVFSFIERQPSLAAPLQDGVEFIVVPFGSGAQNENVVHVADYAFNCF